MVDFSLSEDQVEFQKLARDFCQKEILPKAAYHDTSCEYPLEIIKKAWETGLVNNHVPEAYGGMGLHVLDGTIISEELAYGCSGISTAMEANMLAECPILVAGNEEQKKSFH